MKFILHTLLFFLLVTQICFAQWSPVQSIINVDNTALLSFNLGSTNKYGSIKERINQASIINTLKGYGAYQSLIKVVPESLEVMMYTGESSERKVSLFNTSSETIQCSLRFDDPFTFAMGEIQTLNSITLPGGLELMGNAALQFPPGQILLTPATYDMLGGLFLTNPITSKDVKIEFDFSIGGGSGADGLALCFLDEKELGDRGGGMGWAKYLPNAKSWALEFDTWWNPERDDKDDNHASIVTSELKILAYNSTIPRMQDNGWFHCELIFENNNVKVFLQNDSVGFPRTNILNANVEAYQAIKYYIAFTAGTGGATNNHIIDNILITASNNSRLQPEQVNLVAGDSVEINIKFNAQGLRGGDYYEKLVVVPDSNESFRVEVPIHMIVESAPDISLQSSSDFGRILAGSREINNIQVKNSGFKDLYISNCCSLSGNFRPLLLSFILREGEVRSIPIECLATSNGIIKDTLIIESNDPDESVVKVGIKALVITAPSALIADAIEKVSTSSIELCVRELEAFGTRDAMASNRNSVREYIKEKFLDAGITSVSLDSFQMDGTWQANVVATITGSSTSSGEIIVGGHYDSRANTVSKAPGADDNASGVAAVIEIASVLSSMNYIPNNTIRLVAFAAEEYGLWGSEHFAQTVKTEGRQILLMQNFDMIAYRPNKSDDEVYVIKYDRAAFEAGLDSMLIANVTNLTPVASTMYFYDSDSYSFEANGFPAIFNIEYHLNPNLHTDKDSSQYLDFEYASDIVRSGLALLLTMDDAITDLNIPLETSISDFRLEQNYPNPFNPSTKIKYSVPQSSLVQIKVFDVLGSEIETLLNEEKPIGTYEINWNAANFPSGVYFYQLKAGDFKQTKKMILMK
jgi:hypothetical protein